MKRFLIIGGVGNAGYLEVFSLIKNNIVKYRPQCVHKFLNGAAAATWYTTLEVPELPFLELTKTYNPDENIKYDNYDAIEVSKTKNIPKDYPGVMAVPITFLDRFNPKQFEIVGLQCRHDNPYKTKIYSKEEFENANDLNKSGIIIKDGKMKMMYYRIMIKNKMI